MIHFYCKLCAHFINRDKGVKKVTKDRGKKQKTKEIEPTYVIEKLLRDKTVGGVWKIEVKWKDHVKTTWELVKVLKSDQPAMVEKYMQHLKNNKPEKTAKTAKNTIGKTGATTQQREKRETTKTVKGNRAIRGLL